MKKFYVSWDERHSIEVKATNKEEALEIVKSGQIDFTMEQATYQGNEDIWEVKEKK